MRALNTRCTANGFPVYNDGGTFVVEANSEARITGVTGPESSAGSYRQVGTTGVLLLSPTSILKVEQGATITNGHLLTIASTTPDQAAVIDGRLHFLGGDIVLGDPAYTVGPAHIYSRLQIHDLFLWTGGVYRVWVGRTTDAEFVNDRIICLHNVSIAVSSGGPKLGPIGPQNPGNANLSGKRWNILTVPQIDIEDENLNDTTVPFETTAQSTTWSNTIMIAGAGDALSLRYN